jgi:hypothetical protein
MAGVLRLKVASEVYDRPQSDVLPQRAHVSGPNPFEDSLGTNKGFSLCGGEASKIAEDPFVIVQLESGSPTTGEVRIDSRAQHRATSGQGWATCAKSSTSTFA